MSRAKGKGQVRTGGSMAKPLSEVYEHMPCPMMGVDGKHVGHPYTVKKTKGYTGVWCPGDAQ